MSAAIATPTGSIKEIPLGTLLLGRYRVQVQIESDPLYTVYRALDEVFGDVEVWIKVFKPKVPTEILRQKFPEASQMAAYVGSACIQAPRILGYGFYEETIPFRVTEALTGESLATLMRKGSIPLERSLFLLAQICTALYHAHQGIDINGTHWTILHRDLKPSAIWVESDAGLGDVVKVRHFGLSHLMQTAPEGENHRIIYWGTPAYSAPEVFQGEVTVASDIYSFGIIAYRLLTEQMPILAQGKTLRDWFRAHKEQYPKAIRDLKPALGLSAIIDDLVLSCLAKDPSRRPASAQTILETLQQCFAKSTLANSTSLLESVFQEEVLSISTSTQGTEAGLACMTQTTEAGLAYITQATEPGLSFAKQTLEDTVLDIPKIPKEKTLAEILTSVQWPHYLPLSEIVFAQTILSYASKPTTVWAMLTQEEVLNRRNCLIQSHFQYQLDPYPVLLWVTLLYNDELGARWLPCYLDLGKAQGQNLVRSLCAQDSYGILLFGLEDPQHPLLVLHHSLSAEHKAYLQQGLSTAEQNPTPSGTVADSKALLKQSFLALKSKLKLWNI
jgi:eukaryotic-like serine/threonine-protein kinase